MNIKFQKEEQRYKLKEGEKEKKTKKEKKRKARKMRWTTLCNIEPTKSWKRKY